MREPPGQPASDTPGRVVLGHASVDFLVRRTARSHGLRLTVDPRRGLVVTIPPPSRRGWGRPDDRIEGFLREREAWVLRHLGRLQRERAAVAALGGAVDGGRIHYLGELHAIRVEAAGDGRRRSTVERIGAEDGDELLIRRASPDRRPIERVLEVWLRARAGDAIERAVSLHASALRVTPTSVVLRDPKSRWGSASRQGRLMFSWRLVLAPPAALEAVVVHELAHLRVMGHGSAFWRLVAQQRPDHAAQRAWLRGHSHLLHAAFDRATVRPRARTAGSGARVQPRPACLRGGVDPRRARGTVSALLAPATRAAADGLEGPTVRATARGGSRTKARAFPVHTTAVSIVRAARVALAIALACSVPSSAIGASGALPPVPGSPAPALIAATPTFAQLIGQKLMVAMSGTTPSADLLGRIGRGEVGGVILFSSNITTASALRALTNKLRNAAAAGGQPPLLIATDQEGGSVKRVPWAPPTLSPPQMGNLGSASTAQSQGTSTGTVLLCAGVDIDLAPVADVPASTAAFLYLQGRTWSFDATRTATLTDAFATGLEAGGDIPTMKHFPGLGYATLNTDTNVVTITASKTALAPGLLPYQAAIGHHIPMVMLSNATYSAYDSANGAGWSPAISVGLLRGTLGFTGVSITDSLTGTAAARGLSASSLAIRAARAGTDMILLTGSEASTKATYATLLLDAQNGTIPLAPLQASYTRIVALKSAITAPPADATAPTTQAPVSRLYAPATLGLTTSPVRTYWSASDPCGISAYTLERRLDGGSWYLQSLPAPTSTSIKQSLGLGSPYRYVAKASDGAGNTSGWAYGASFEPLITQQTATAVSYGGTWHAVSNSYASGGSLKYATAAGASATFTFTGYGVSWVAYRGPDRGSAAIYLDGVRYATVNLYSASYSARQIVYAANWSANGLHTIRVVDLGTVGHSRIDVDAFARLDRF